MRLQRDLCGFDPIEGLSELLKEAHYARSTKNVILGCKVSILAKCGPPAIIQGEDSPNNP